MATTMASTENNGLLLDEDSNLAVRCAQVMGATCRPDIGWDLAAFRRL